jgi:hypothetical protein
MREPQVDQGGLEIDDVHVNFDNERLRFPVKTLVFSVVLFVTGTALLIAGLVEEFAEDDKSKGMAMWILGLITFIPGAYYSVLFWKAYRAKSASERMNILKEIPDL